ncbi:MAG: hypothetical protein ACI9H8_001729 [Lysobacterales bacterium]|jgi:hypothetical protein
MKPQTSFSLLGAEYIFVVAFRASHLTKPAFIKETNINKTLVMLGA